MLARNRYDGAWIVEQEYPSAERYRFRHTIGPNRRSATRATVQGRDGAMRSFETSTVPQFLKDLP